MMLIVPMASFSEDTYQVVELNALHNNYQFLEVLAFPTKQFGHVSTDFVVILLLNHSENFSLTSLEWACLPIESSFSTPYRFWGLIFGEFGVFLNQVGYRLISKQHEVAGATGLWKHLHSQQTLEIITVPNKHSENYNCLPRQSNVCITFWTIESPFLPRFTVSVFPCPNIKLDSD